MHAFINTCVSRCLHILLNSTVKNSTVVQKTNRHFMNLVPLEVLFHSSYSTKYNSFYKGYSFTIKMEALQMSTR